MGRILDLCGEIAASAEEGADGLLLPPEVWDRLRADWDDEDIEDAMGLVNDSLMQAELVESADSLSARLVEILGTFGEAAAFRRVEEGTAAVTTGMLGQLARRVARLEEVLESYREGSPPDRHGFEALQRRLIDLGIENEMTSDDDFSEPLLPGSGGGEDADEDETE